METRIQEDKIRKASCEMSSIRFGCMLIFLGICLLFQSGCGGSGDQPELGLVTGTITLNGKPLSGIAVVFQPDSGRPSRGMTDAEGKYELTYIRQTRGAKIGSNRVEIAPSEDGEAAEAENQDDENQSPTKRPKSGKPTIPARYNVRSELKVDVKSGSNTFDFKLES
jgi:hypothetical protein